MTVPSITVRNRQQKISVNVAELEKFAGNALNRCLQLKRGKRTHLRKLNAVAVWLISRALASSRIRRPGAARSKEDEKHTRENPPLHAHSNWNRFTGLN